MRPKKRPSPHFYPFRLIAFVLPVCLTSCALVPAIHPRSVKVTATAYSWGASCNGPWGPRNALGAPLRSGKISSAAADWSRLPLGTVFRVRETGRIHEVDDYGSAMTGLDKVDLYKPNYREVNDWGARRVTLDVIKWGDKKRSLAVLIPRIKYAHVREMVRELEEGSRGKVRPPSASRKVDRLFGKG